MQIFPKAVNNKFMISDVEQVRSQDDPHNRLASLDPDGKTASAKGIFLLWKPVYLWSFPGLLPLQRGHQGAALRQPDRIVLPLHPFLI